MLALEVTTTPDDLREPEVGVVPAGVRTRAARMDERLLDWVRTAHIGSRYTTSVCTGALVLTSAGVLDGLESTTHWAALEELERPVKRRVVEQGKVITAAGVSSGIDMALTLVDRLAGPDVAQAIQLGIEYDPEPPFDAGSPDKAPAQLVDIVRQVQRAEEEEAAAAEAV